MTDQKTISRYPVNGIENLPNDLQEKILSIQEKAGFIPNVFLVLAHRPKELRAFIDYHNALIERDSGLTQSDKEMIVVATSGGNNCLYCVIAHGAILRVRTKNPTIADQVAINFRKADITNRQMAMLEFSEKVSNDSAAINETDFKKLHSLGFTDEDIWDITGITAFFGLSNRMANLTDMQPNIEFYLMGR